MPNEVANLAPAATAPASSSGVVTSPTPRHGLRNFGQNGLDRFRRSGLAPGEFERRYPASHQGPRQGDRKFDPLQGHDGHNGAGNE